MQNRDRTRQEVENCRLNRFVLMEESGQPKIDIQPEEAKIIGDLSDDDRRRIIVNRSGVFKYLQPFYENKWNHKMDISDKNLRSIYSNLYIKNQEKELERRKDLLLYQLFKDNEKLKNVQGISRRGGSTNFTKHYKKSSNSSATLPTLRSPKDFSLDDPHLGRTIRTEQRDVLYSPSGKGATSITKRNKSVQFDLGPDVVNSTESIVFEEVKELFDSGTGIEGHSPKKRVVRA